MEDAPVGDELMEWLNTNYIGPPTEEGDHLSALDRPWEDENFWPYLTRYANTLRGINFVNRALFSGQHCVDCPKLLLSSWTYYLTIRPPISDI